MAVKTYIITYVKLSGCAIQYDPEFEKGSSTSDGFDEYRFNKRDFPETGADVSFTTQEGYHPKVTIYKDPTVSGGHITDFGTLISNDVGSSFHIPKNLDADSQQYLIIAEAVSDSGINFTYDKTPKFREQETPHVYFDTIDGSVARTEKRRYTYATADSSVVGFIDGNGSRMNFKKIHDFMSEEDLSNGDKIKAFQIFNPENEKIIPSEDIVNGVSQLPDYPGEAALSVRLHSLHSDLILISFDSAYTNTVEGATVSFPEPGLYLCEGADTAEGGIGVSVTVEIPAETNPFSKNVIVKAHTEYTAHINGKIGESTGGLNGVFLRADASLTTIAGATWEEARDAYVAGKTVLLAQETKTDVRYYTRIDYDSANSKLSFGNIYWYSDGRIEKEGVHNV